MKRALTVAVIFVATLASNLGQVARAQNKWKFGIGTGLASFSLDGDIGFDTATGPVVFDVDLDNSDTADLVESGLGVAGLAAKGKWKIGYFVSRISLEDGDGQLQAEWDRTKIEVVTTYRFAKTGNHGWGVAIGVRNIGHDWTFNVGGTDVREIDESWTDAVVGVAHRVSLAQRWSWNNLVQTTFGESEGTASFNTALGWQVAKHWNLNFTLNFERNEFEEESPGDRDFYIYDVDEPSIAVGFLYTW